MTARREKISAPNIRRLAAYFSDAALLSEYGVTKEQVDRAFAIMGDERPSPRPLLLLEMIKTVPNRNITLVEERRVTNYSRRLDEAILALDTKLTAKLQKIGVLYVWELAIKSTDWGMANLGPEATATLSYLLEDLEFAFNASCFDVNLQEAITRTDPSRRST